MYLKKIIAVILSAVLIISALPVMSFAVGTSGNEITFAVDTGAAMDWYTFGAEDAIADALTGIVEQAPSGCTFSVVTNSQVSARTNKETAIEQLYNITAYTGTCDMEVLVENAATLFSGNANKTLFIVTNQWAQIEEKVLLLEAQGVTVYVVALESNKEMAEEIQGLYQNAIVCQNAKEMSYRLADVYEEMTNLIVPPTATVQLMATTSQAAETTTYNSSFRFKKHDFDQAMTDHSAGAALAALLNMYYLMPANVTGKYQVTNAEAVEKIGNGITYGLLESPNDYGLLTFWNGKADALLTSPYYAKQGYGIMSNISIVENNLRRRFPVMISVGKTNPQYYLITKFEDGESEDTFTVYNPANEDPSNTELPPLKSSQLTNQYVRVLDTQKYFNSIYTTHSVQATVTRSDRLTGTVSFSVPSGYDDDKVHTYPALGKAVNVSDDGKATINVERNTEFSVAIDTNWDNLLPNIYNSTMNFRILLFEDVEYDYWAATDIFNMSNQGVINGRNELSDPMTPSIFDPLGDATITEYLAMTIRAADMLKPTAIPNMSAGEEWTYPGDYEAYAIQHEYVSNSVECNEKIKRELAFHITWEILSSDECRTPTHLVEYEIDDPVSEMPFPDLTSKLDYNISVAQLYKNGIVAGYPDGTLRPLENINRAESAKVLSRCIQKFDVKNSSVPMNDGTMAHLLTSIPIGIPTGGVIGQDGNVAFTFHTDETGLYPISFSGNGVSLRVYESFVDSDGKTHYYRCYPKAGKAGTQFPLQANKDLVVSLSGPSGTEYSLRVGEAQQGSTEKPLKRTAYIVFYDSPIKRYLDSEGICVPGAPTTGEWDSYHRYDITDNNDLVSENPFFTNYLNVFDDSIDPVFILSVRDADFNTKRMDDADKVAIAPDGSANYVNNNQSRIVNHARSQDINTISVSGSNIEYGETGLTFAQYKGMIVDNVSTEMANIIKGFYCASQSANANMPKFYIGMPTFHLPGNQTSSVFVDKYYEIAIGTQENPGIYYATLNKLPSGVGEECIEGIYNGWEETTDIRGGDGELTIGFQLLSKISKFAHDNGKKFLWIPYGGMNGVGNLANTGIYQDKEKEKSYDLFDVVITQPGTYFDDDFKVSFKDSKVSVGESGKGRLAKLFDLYHSLKSGVIISGSTGVEDSQKGTPVNGGKITDTKLGCQIEYDMALLTGRWYLGENPSYSKQKAQNFLLVLDVLKPFVYGNTSAFATYSGGMNEQAYDLVGRIESNNNRHSLINYQTALGVRNQPTPEEMQREGPIRDTDIGNGKPYNWFFDYISEWANTMTDEDDKEKIQYNSAYPKDLLYEITLGIMKNQWSQGVKDFLAIPEGMLVQDENGDAQKGTDGYYHMKTTGFYYNY